MQRREFVRKISTLTLGLYALPGMSLSFGSIQKWHDRKQKAFRTADLAPVSEALEKQFRQLLQWMKANGWTRYLHEVLGVNLDTGDLKQALIQQLDESNLTQLRQQPGSGYDDYLGERLIEPGFPAYSLLFHTLASPRVRPGKDVLQYPSLQQIDLLENYIYALCGWEQLKAMYDIHAQEELVFAVFAYEYRPAFKTPHHAYADMVYSRTGIARIGSEAPHYDALNRCHTNEPADPRSVKQVAVIPARYGLFIARKVTSDKIALVKEAVHKGDDAKDDRDDDHKFFLQPIRKIFDDDLLVNSAKLAFSEEHRSEKLQKLAQWKGISEWHGATPTPRASQDLVTQDEKKRRAGSSFLVISQPAALIRLAREQGKPVFFQVPTHTTDPYDNRYFTAFCTQTVEDVELLEGYEQIGRIYNKYEAPRNQPLFVNITYEQKNDTSYSPLVKTKDKDFEQKLQEGKYFAPLFEDSICDGHVTVATHSLVQGTLKGMPADCLPAFSIVTAPDFFPQVDPLDLVSYDTAPGISDESNFYEGGVASLSTARIRPNPKMIQATGDDTRDTYLAVFSEPLKENTTVSQQQLTLYKDPASARDYDISGFLPDVASSVFAPGWDVTYCSREGEEDIYIGTEGLGSPFIEDMKFCAALNGMWPATSPDAARTYQGSNESAYRNPTAVPLLDSEIGIAPDSPAGKDHTCTGWDGEQGPFLEKRDGRWKINFTDLGRADAVGNALRGQLDMSKLRKLKSAELIARMECLRLCIHTLPQKNFRDNIYKAKIAGYTYLWLVSAEKVHWGKEDAAALGIPQDLVGHDKKWITGKEHAQVTGEGYLYVFTNSAPDGDDENEKSGEQNPVKAKEWAPDLKRRRLDCREIYVCQVTHDPSAAHRIAWTEVQNGIINWQLA